MERKESLQILLHDINFRFCSTRHNSLETESFTDTSLYSDATFRCSIGDYGLQSPESLRAMPINDLRIVHSQLQTDVNELSQHLIRQLKRRDRLLNRTQAKCNMLTAILQAHSQKRSVDTKLQFSLEPPVTESGYDQWLNAMKAVARLPDGIPHHFRKKLWLTLAQHHITSRGIDWAETCHFAFNERMNPDDDKLGMQIIKDLHRTGWSGLSAEQERILLKRVLLAYARFNKTIGYCQGFNVIAALVLEVTEYKEQVALKMMIFLIEQVLPSGYFDQTLRALSVDMAVLRDLLHQRLPKMATHLDFLQHNSVSEYEPPLTNVFTMQWFLTLFATCLPKSAVFRVWDSLMLEGSEVLLRTALAIWAKIAKRVCKTKTADEFYELMGTLSQEMLQMSANESNDLMQLIYTMAEFPYPGLAELRERYTWNIQPFSSTFKLLRQQVTSILHSDPEDSSDTEQNCIAGFLTADKGCGSQRSPGVDLNALQKQYKLMKQRQKQAAVILQNAYEKGQKRMAINSARMRPLSPCQPEAFNHLYISGAPPTGSFNTLNGTIPVASKTVQPSSAVREKRRISRTVSQNSNTSQASSCTLQGSITPTSPTPFLFPSRKPLRRSASFDSSQLLPNHSQLLIRSKSCVEMKHEKVPLEKKKKSLITSVIAHSPLGTTTPSLSNSKKSVTRKKSNPNTNPMLNRSRAIINSVAVERPKPGFNPFPTRHRSALIEREKQYGLY